MKKKFITGIAVLSVLGIGGISAMNIHKNQELAEAMNKRYLAAMELFQNVIETELLETDFTSIKESIDNKKCTAQTEEQMTDIEETLELDEEESLSILGEQENLYEDYMAQLEADRITDKIEKEYLNYIDFKEDAKYKDAYTKISKLLEELAISYAETDVEEMDNSKRSKEDFADITGLTDELLDEMYEYYGNWLELTQNEDTALAGITDVLQSRGYYDKDNSNSETTQEEVAEGTTSNNQANNNENKNNDDSHSEGGSNNTGGENNGIAQNNEVVNTENQVETAADRLDRCGTSLEGGKIGLSEEGYQKELEALQGLKGY